MSVKESSTVKLIYIFNFKYDLDFHNWMAALTLKFYLTLSERSSYFTFTITAEIVNTDIKVERYTMDKKKQRYKIEWLLTYLGQIW